MTKNITGIHQVFFLIDRTLDFSKYPGYFVAGYHDEHTSEDHQVFLVRFIHDSLFVSSGVSKMACFPRQLATLTRNIGLRVLTAVISAYCVFHFIKKSLLKLFFSRKGHIKL